MADLEIVEFDINQDISADRQGMELHQATPYFEDYLQRVFTDLNAINNEVGSGVQSLANLGAGEGVFAQEVAQVAQLKSLLAGTGITITSDADEITINSTVTSNIDNGTETNSLTHWNNGTARWEELVQVKLSWVGGVATFQVEDDLGTDVTGITIDGDGQLGLYFDNTEVVQTRASGAGGLFVNNLATGAGFERALTTADLGGGGALPAPTVDNAMLTANLGGGNWTELPELTMDVVANVLTVQVEDAGATLQTVFTADADLDFRAFYDGLVAAYTLTDGWGIQTSSTNAVLRGYDSTATEQGQLQFNNSTFGLALNSIINSQLVTLLSRDSVGTLTTLAQFDPDDAVDLYFDAGLAFSTTSLGADTFSQAGVGNAGQFRVFGGSNATPDHFDIIKDDGNTNCVLTNNDPGGDLRLRVRNAANTTTDTGVLITADGAVELFFDATAVVATQAAGLNIGTNGTNDPFIEFFDTTIGGTSLGLIQFGDVADDGQWQIVGNVVSQSFDVTGTDAGSAFNLMIDADPDGRVGLYFDGDLIVETNAQGVQLTAAAATSGALQISADVGQTTQINFEETTTTRLQMAWLAATNLGRLRITDTTDDYLITNLADGDMARFNGGGSVELYNNDVLVFNTTTQGAQLTAGTAIGGALEISADVGQNTQINFEETTTTHMQLAWLASTNLGRLRITDTTDDFLITNLADGDMARFNGGGAVDLYHNASLAFSTTSDGAAVQDPGGDNPELVFLQDSGAQNGFIQFVGANNLLIRNEINSGEVRLQAHDSGGTNRTPVRAGTVGTASALAFHNTAPVIQQTTTSQTPATFVANTSGIADDSATWGGYTVGDIVAILQAYGLIA